MTYEPLIAKIDDLYPGGRYVVRFRSGDVRECEFDGEFLRHTRSEAAWAPDDPAVLKILPAGRRAGDLGGPTRAGSPRCESRSVASGGSREFCTCDVCF